MCGIAAILDPAGQAPAGAGEAMARALAHRGPDGHAVRPAGPCTLVHTRLAIIDVKGGAQPLASEDGAVTAIVNGEIYNHLELRRQLEDAGHTFATHSDSEVVVHGYEQEGAAFIRRLNGIFALAIWDEQRGRLVAARDPFGVKPLYWWSDGRRLALASEVGALLAAGLARPSIDPVALDHFLAFRCVPAPRTLFAGVSKLPAASTLTAAPGGGAIVESFREPPGQRLPGDAAELAGELRERFVDAVERQMMSDVPYGALLSGGVDSAAVVAAMAARSDRAPSTFTIGFPGAGDVLDERAAAESTAAALGTDHHSTAMRQTDFLAELGECVRRLEEPCGMPSAPALLQLSRFAAERVKVVLSGQGADEPHGGYGHHRAAAALDGLSRIPAALGPAARALAGALPGNERARRAARLVGPMQPIDRLLRLVEVTDHEQRARLAGTALEDAEAERRAIAGDIVADVGDGDALEQALYLDSHLFLPDRLLLCADKMSMASSLEQRVPFLDLELMRFVERIPARKRADIRAGKRLHRLALEGLVPRAALDRPKHGFSTPYDDWLRSDLGGEVRRRYSPGDPLADVLDVGEVGRLVDEHQSGRADHKNVLYCLLELSQWHREFVEGRVGAQAA
jgi:asparagine synthase (glutamine-hydrolysing)